MTDTGIYATAPRGADDRLRYAEACLKQGMSYQAAAAAASACVADLMEFAPGYGPQARSAPTIEERTPFGRCASTLSAATPEEQRRIAALALRFVYEDGGAYAIQAVVKNVLAALPPRSHVSPRERLLDIVDRIALSHGLTREQVMGRSRRRECDLARAEAYWTVCKEAGLSQSAVARLFGRDSTTICHGLRAYEARLAEAAK